MAEILLITRAMSLSVDVLPALTLLTHKVKVVQPDIGQLLGAKPSDLLFIDGDHTVEGCRSDWLLAQRVGARVVGFHDISKRRIPGDPGVRRHEWRAITELAASGG